MEPMNAFLNSHRQEFKSYVDEICAIPTDRVQSSLPPSYATPITILSRLPQTSKEGFPSLPYLIDQTREFATLVATWNDALASASTQTRPTIEDGDAIFSFDNICHALHIKTRDTLDRAELAERPSGMLEVKWEQLIERMDHAAFASAASHNQRHPALDPSLSTSPSLKRRITADSVNTTGNSSVVSIDKPPPDVPHHFRGVGTPSAPRSEYTDRSSPIDLGSEPPGSSSGMWDPGTESRAGSDRWRFPAHALSWDDPAENPAAEEYEGDGDDEEAYERTTGLFRPGRRGIWEPASGVRESLRSVEVGDWGLRVRKEEEGSVGASPASSHTAAAAVAALEREKERGQRSPVSPRDVMGKRLADVWGFRKKSAPSIGGGVGSGGSGGSGGEGQAMEMRKGSVGGGSGSGAGAGGSNSGKRDGAKENRKGKGREREKDRDKDRDRNKERDRDRDRDRNKERNKERR